ncbi:hypothetical protein [Halostella litorea]|uniref:hypothetical protein n=1 Tax=Halostella litorea TaxID=2528831 RepID=UPI00109336EF|nr:hypothetical protein [Halostella litorea]
MQRRRLLGALTVGIGAFGGCLSRLDGGDAADDTNDDTDTTTDGDDGSDDGVRVTDATVTPAVVAANSPDSIGTYGDRDEQYVLATVEADDLQAPPPDEFALAAGGSEYPATTEVGYTSRLWERDSPYGEDAGFEGWLAFRLPKPLDADAPAVAWEGSEHALGDDAVAELARPPTDWEITEFATPDAVALGEEATVSLTVENVGDADGTFVGALNRVGPWIAYAPETAVTLDVAAGETASWEFGHTVDERHGSDAAERAMRFHLQWRGDQLTREVTVEME